MGFLHPELLLLALPAWLLWRRFPGVEGGDRRGLARGTAWVRLAVLALLVLALARPYLAAGDRGRDLVVVVDRSRSMPAGGDALGLEWVTLAEEERRAGDRVAVVSFAGGATVERPPSADGRFAGFAAALERDGTDLAGALETALELIPAGRPGGIVVVSDGESNGRDPLPVARRAFARGVRVDARVVARPPAVDLSVERIDLPDDVAALEPFQFSAWVRADRRTEAEFALQRGGETISTGRRVFEPGLNRLLFRDVLTRPGVRDYSLRLSGAGDRVPENDVGLGATRVVGQRALLVLNDDGAEDSLTSALRAAGLPLEVASPESARLDRVGLAAFRAVVLENVEAGRLSRGLPALRDFVLERGGGLLVTGGRASFGIGGYHLSPIDELLPVSMEMRQEKRKLGVALAIVMDRSGSMGVEAAPGMTKMDLANLGASAAIELLAPIDSVGVIAVDSSAHVVQPLVAAEDLGELTSTVRKVRSGGGGIFVKTGLLEARDLLEGAPQANRHVVLFADAADAEEQAGCPELIGEMLADGVTLSVIALGSPGDVDGPFLQYAAELGEGQAYFTTQPDELPRLFAQDTLTVARATFVEEPTACDALPDLLGVGQLGAGGEDLGFPRLDGYNLTWLREGGVAGAVTLDEHRAPAFAFAYRGLGRTAAFTGQIGGAHGPSVVAWPGFAPFFVTLARWLLGPPESGALFTSVRREGGVAIVTVEVDPDAPEPPSTAGLRLRTTDATGATSEASFERVADGVLEARVPLEREGVVLGTVRTAEGGFADVPPVALPYSPEFEATDDPARGERLLRRITSETGGGLVGVAGQLFRGPREARVWRVITRELLLAALLLVVVEIAGRRLQLWSTLAAAVARRRATRRATRPAAETAREPSRDGREAPGARSTTPAAEEPAPSVAPAARPAPERDADLGDALARARRAARRELDR